MNKRKTSKDARKKRKRQVLRNRIFLVVFLILLILLVKNLVSLGDDKKSSDRFFTLIGTGDSSTSKNNDIDDQKVEYVEATDREGWIANITKAKKTNKNAQVILDNVGNIREELLKMAGTNPDTINFVAKYADPNISYEDKYPSKIYKNLDYPYYIQWDQKWGYQDYGTGIIGNAGCAPTSLAMMLSGMTGERILPSEVATLATKNGNVGDYGTDWNIYPFIAKEYNLNIKEIEKSNNSIIKELDKGNPIIISVGKGTFTTISHVMLIVGHEDGQLQIYDPNNLQNTKKLWDFTTFQNEVKNMWVFSN